MQATVITGLAHNNFGFGLQAAAAALALADKSSLAMAAASFTAGVTGELLTVLREDREQEEQEAAAAQQVLEQLQRARSQVWQVPGFVMPRRVDDS